MACFSKKAKEQPQLILPEAPRIPTAEEIINAASTRAKTDFPTAYGAREGALKDISGGALNFDPNFFKRYDLTSPQSLTQDYFKQFQPTDFERSLVGTEFESIMPQVEKRILGQLSASGVASSPIAARLIGDQSRNLLVQGGRYLADQGQRRAELGLQRESDLYNLGQRRAEGGIQGITSGLNARIGIDPYNMILPQAELAARQSNLQADYNYQRALEQAKADYARNLSIYNQPGVGGTIGSLIGGGLALGAAIPTGGASLAYLPMAAAGGGALGTLFGGGESPINFAQAMELQSMPQTLQNQKLYGKYLQSLISPTPQISSGSPLPVMPNISHDNLWSLSGSVN